MNFSENQLKAVKTRNKNILVSASAGSGKTAVLTGRVADIIKQPENSIENLLVVTFTKAAAEEMSERIEIKIRELLSDSKEKNKAHLRAQLRLLSSAEITTIDSFCGRLVRRFFYKTDIDPGFTVAPESRLTDTKQEAMERVINGAFKKAEAGETLYVPFYDLCDMVSGNGTTTLELEDEISRIYADLSSLPYPEKWLKETLDGLWAETYEEYLSLPVCKAVKDGMGLKWAAELIGEADDILTEEFRKDILSEERENIEAAEAAAEKGDILRLIESLNKTEFNTFKNDARKLDPERSDEAKNLRNKAKEIVLKAKMTCRFFTEESFNIYKSHLPYLKLFYTLVGDFIKEYYKLKSEKNIYEFSDIERACLNMLTDEEGHETETAAHLKERYTEILIDEYQDTNPLQEEILKALSRSNNRFMVGDIKQSIYGFRNADPTIFADKYNRFSENEEEESKLILLNENYRSVPEILDFINIVFSKIMSKELGGAEYEPLNFPEGSPLAKLKRHKVQVCFLDRTVKIDPEEEYINEETELLRETAESSSGAEALLIAGKIKELMKEDKSIGYGDIVILLSVLKGTADVYIDILEKCGIPALTDKPADSTNFIENKTMLSFLKITDNPLSDIDLVAVLHSPIYRLTTEELSLIRLSRGRADSSFYELSKDYAKNHTDEISEKLNRFFEDRSYFEERFKTEPINAVLSEIYEKTDYYNYLNLLNDSPKRRANLDKLLDLGAEYDAVSQGGLYGFLKYIDSITEGDDFKQAQVLSPKTNAVRIMTIHGSKGLQFPVVFLSQARHSFGKANRKNKIIFNKNLGICMAYFDPKDRIVYETAAEKAAEIKNKRDTAAEAIRRYYVAATRAEKRLFITASKSSRKKKLTSGKEILQSFIEDYENPLNTSGKNIPPEAVYSTDNFFKLLMAALSGEKEIGFSVDYISWYQLGGIFENSGKEIYNRELKTAALKKAVYPYEACVTLPTNLSVTEIKREANEEEYTKTYGPAEFSFVMPKFLKKTSEALTPMEVGTAYHTLISALDYKNLPSDIEEFKQEAAKSGLLTEQEAEAVENRKILAYVNSEVAKRASKALYVKKEHSFTMGLSAAEVYPELKDITDGEIILTHGIIDMFFEEPDGIVIVDFKTDKIKDDEKLKKAYFPQLSIYKTAVEEATGKKVKELLLCLINRETVLSLM